MYNASHVDDLLITSESNSMIDVLCAGLTRKYGDVTRKDGPIVNYLGIVFDLSRSGEARVTMKGYVDDLLSGSGIPGVARSPATEDLFDVSEKPMVAEERRVKFHTVLSKEDEARVPASDSVPGH